jgi:hypothetical protein
MKNPRSPQLTAIRVDTPQAPQAPSRPPEPVSAWTRFWFTPTSPTGLHVVRILTGLLCLLWLLPLAGHIDSLFGTHGWFDTQAYTEAQEIARRTRGDLPTSNWGIQFLAGNNATALACIYWSSIGVLVLFTLGVASRLTAVLTWVIVVSFTANPAMEYDADAFLAIFAFYLMVGYLFLGLMHGNLSPLGRIFGSCQASVFGRHRGAGTLSSSVAATVSMRLLQIHLAILIVTSGLHKLQFGDWWAGYVFWYLLYPAGPAALKTVHEHAADAQSFLFVLSVGAYAVLAWQLGFPLFAWRRRWSSEAVDDADATPIQKIVGWLIGPRTILFGGALLGCLGMMFLYELPLLGPALIIACLTYLTPEEWQKLRLLLARVPGLRRLTAPPAAAGEPAKQWPKQAEGRDNLVTAGRN